MNKRQQAQVIREHHKYLCDQVDRQQWLNGCHQQRLAEQRVSHPAELQRLKYDYHQMLRRDRERYYSTR